MFNLYSMQIGNINWAWAAMGGCVNWGVSVGWVGYKYWCTIRFGQCEYPLSEVNTAGYLQLG